jgi:hypothetical protein
MQKSDWFIHLSQKSGAFPGLAFYGQWMTLKSTVLRENSSNSPTSMRRAWRTEDPTRRSGAAMLA